MLARGPAIAGAAGVAGSCARSGVCSRVHPSASAATSARAAFVLTAEMSPVTLRRLTSGLHRAMTRPRAKKWSRADGAKNVPGRGGGTDFVSQNVHVHIVRFVAYISGRNAQWHTQIEWLARRCATA